MNNEVREALIESARQVREDGGTPDWIVFNGRMIHHGELYSGVFDGILWENGDYVRDVD